MEEPPTKKNKCEYCVVCNNVASDQQDKNIEEYTNFLINQLVPLTAGEKIKFSSSKILFAFCMNCIEVLNELMALKVSMEFLVKSIKKKRLELRCKIAQIKENFGQEELNDFRKVATRSLHPRISMYKDNALLKEDKYRPVALLLNNEMTVTSSKTNKVGITIKNQRSLLPSPKCHKHVRITSNPNVVSKSNMISDNTVNSQSTVKKISQLEVPSLNSFREMGGEVKIKLQISDCEVDRESVSKGRVASESACSKRQEDGSDKYVEDTFLPLDYHERPESDSEIEIKPEMVEIEEAADDDEFEIHNWEELENNSKSNEMFSSDSSNNIPTNKMKNKDGRRFFAGKFFNKAPIVVDVRQTATLDCETKKKWLKPMLTTQQICYLALLYPERNFQTAREIGDFVCEHFPFFNDIKRNYLESQFKQAFTKKAYFVNYFDHQKGDTVYGVVGTSIVVKEKELIYKYLCSEDILTTMAFPEHVYDFQKALKPKPIPSPPHQPTEESLNSHLHYSQTSLDSPISIVRKASAESNAVKKALRQKIRNSDACQGPSTGKSFYGYLQNSQTSLESGDLGTITISTSLPETSVLYEPPPSQIPGRNNIGFTTPYVPPTESSYNGYVKSENIDDDVTFISETSTAGGVVDTPVVQYLPVDELLGRNTFPKPPITCEEICICAIMNAESMLVSVADVLKFIRENFPAFYDPSIPDRLCISNIASALSQDQFRLISRVSEAFVADSFHMLNNDPIETLYPFLYTVYASAMAPCWRETTADTLSCKDNLAAMAFPERVYGFIQNVLTRTIMPDACFYLVQNQQTN